MRPPRHDGEVSNDPLLMEIPYADPLALFARVAGDSHAALLHSAVADARGRHSFIAADPFKVLVCREGRVEIDGVPVPGAPFDVLRAELARHPQAAVGAGRAFRGGAVGYVGYEMGRHLERLPRPPADPMDVPEMQLLFCDVVVAFDHHARRAHIISTGQPEPVGDRRRVRALERLARGGAPLRRNPSRRRPPRPRPASRPTSRPTSRARPTSSPCGGSSTTSSPATSSRPTSRSACGAELPDGLRRSTSTPRLRAGNPAPFAAYLDARTTSAIASSSPERFLRLDGRARWRPARSRARARAGATPAEDDARWRPSCSPRATRTAPRT